uniref:RRM domain-containing protein n=1 Tax=Salarias fasciatus TaxID=181472 RepID=A0A672HGM5_SALFA
MSRVYIGRLSYRAREKDVERFFKGYGKILEVDLKNGYGFVEFDDPRDADDAVYDLNGKDLCGERVIVEHTKGPRRDGGYGARSKCPAQCCLPSGDLFITGSQSKGQSLKRVLGG